MKEFKGGRGNVFGLPEILEDWEGGLSLTHMKGVFPFFTPRKTSTRGFQIFQGVKKVNIGVK